MPKEDYIEKHLNQMSRALGKVLFNAMGDSNEGQIKLSVELLEQKIEEVLDLPFEKTIELNNDEFISELINKRDFNEDNFQKLADLLFQLALMNQSQNNQEKSVRLFKKCLALYLQVDKTSTVFSFERNQRVKMINKLMK